MFRPATPTVAKTLFFVEKTVVCNAKPMFSLWKTVVCNITPMFFHSKTVVSKKRCLGLAPRPKPEPFFSGKL